VVVVVVVVELVLIWAANVTSMSATTNNIEIWTGTVSTIGTSTITGAFSGSVTSVETGLNAQEFSASSGSSTVWGKDTGGGISNASSTTATFPKLTPRGSGELYFGDAVEANTGSAGTTPGFTYALTDKANVVAYDTKVSSAVQPMAKQSPGSVSGGLAVLITVSGSSATPHPTVSAVDSLATKEGNDTTTLAVSPGHVGDLLVLAVEVFSPSIKASSVSGGGVSSWTRVEGPFTSYPTIGPGTLSDIIVALFLIVVPLAVIGLVVLLLVRRRRTRAASTAS